MLDESSPPSAMPVWRVAAFRKLWSAQTLSLFGNQITALAVPLLAVERLAATPLQMGLLVMAATLPLPVVGLVAGVWVDRRRRRPILIAADLCRAALLCVIVLAAVTDRLSIALLAGIVFLIGILSAWFDIAHASLLPAILRSEQLVEGNSRLEVGRSGAQIIGAGLAGILIQAASAVGAVVVDAVTFLVSALLIWRIQVSEAITPRPGRRLWREAGEGLAVVWANRYLATMARSLSVFNLFGQMLNAVFVLFAVRILGLSAGELGLTMAAGSLGILVGATLASPLSRRLGLGPTIILGAVVSDLALLLVPLAALLPAYAFPVLIASRFIATVFGPITAISQLSLRQQLTPSHLLGRVNATMMVLGQGLAPLGALAGGGLGSLIGVPATVLVAALGVQIGFVILLCSPLRGLRASTVTAG